jgi:hypothetical protein
MFDDYNNFYKGKADGRGIVRRRRARSPQRGCEAASRLSAVCGAPGQYLHGLREVCS